ncbi:FAD-dependent monooxygenase [Streptomyces sp. WZ-12]|uniref:FAD-dependent monooxygenase n=1 Tax=Streptomyces sp. WZ-12 TaxID=3030210 RepID=UPI002380F547|nr:FAD-dependent monooxygenase [Streptomyces sp. WZ-12]
MSAQVIVAGGGPVGLLTAALLDAAGVRVEVFERNEGPSEHSKATTMHPRTLEVLATVETAGGRRLADVLVDHGTPRPSAHFAVLPDRLDYSGLDTPFPIVLLIPQADTERFLADHLRWRGVPVHYGQAVQGWEEVDGGLRVRAGDRDHTAGYLVGADGAHSHVRKLSSIAFPGREPTAVGFVADVDLANPPVVAGQLWHHDTGFVSTVPMPGGKWRVFGTEVGDTGLTAEEVRQRQSEPFGLEELRAALRRIAGTDFGLRAAPWISRASDSTRRATRYRSGRVLLAGDAAHVHLPAGGQGLNVGLQDAMNLAWKLAAEIHGWAPAHLIDGAGSYEHERQHVAEQLMANTLAQGALMHTFTAGGQALRDLVSGLIGRGGDTAEELAGSLSGLSVSYPQPEGTHPLVGTRAPDLPLADGGTLHRALRHDRYLLVDFTPEGHFAELGSARVEVRAAPSPSGTWSTLCAVLVRPDGYLAHATPSADPLGLADALAQWTTADGATVSVA